MALNVFRLVLRHAVGQAIVEWNAVEHWKRSHPRRRSSAATSIEANKLFTAEELSGLLAVTRRDAALYYPLVLFLADTGARIGEASALTWDDTALAAAILATLESPPRASDMRAAAERFRPDPIVDTYLELLLGDGRSAGQSAPG